MEEQNTKPKRYRKQQSATKLLRNRKVVAIALEGNKTQKEIAAAVDVDRRTIRRILTSPDIKKILKDAENEIHLLVDKAVKTVEQAMDGAPLDMTNGLKASITLLKSVGVLKDKVDLSHSFPKPTIIEKRNGDQVILGAAYDDDETAA